MLGILKEIIIMKKDIYKKIEEIFKNNNGYARTQDILDVNIYSSHLYKIEEEGEVTKIKKRALSLE